MKLSALLPAAFMSFVLLSVAGCGKQPQQMQMPPVPVGVTTVQPQSVPLVREFVGRLSATRSADVRARVAGVLEKRLYKEGTEVKEGQPLFQIDPTPLQAELEAAVATLARAEAEATNAKVIADRARKLIAQKLVAQADLDNAEASERTTAAQMKQAQAAVQSARIRLGYALVRAPIAGRAGQQQVTEGALVGQDEATLLTMIEQIHPIYVNFDLPATGIERLARAESEGSVSTNLPHAQVEVLQPDGTLYGYKGTVDFTGTTVDPTTGTVAFRGTIPNPERHLLPGMFVRVRLAMGERNRVFLVPQTAVMRDPSGAYLFVVGPDNRATQKHVTTEFMQGADWIVSQGLEPGDRVIVRGVANLRPDAPVQPSPVDEPAAAQAASSTPATTKAR
jgi:membrane fusion protein (multidrug efflux system)